MLVNWGYSVKFMTCREVHVVGIDDVRGEEVVESAANAWYIISGSLWRLAHDTLDGVNVLETFIKS
jgi:hypothetical protein